MPTLVELLSLSGRTAVVTGGGAGLGRATVLRLAESGATVAVADLDPEAATEVAAEVVGSGGSAFPVPLDATDPESSTRAAEQVVSRTGRLDVWVNNAGVYRMAALLGPVDEVWNLTMDLNVRGVLAGARAAARAMVAAGSGGCVVNIDSIAGTRAGHPSMTAYAASKAAVRSLTTNLAAALGPHGIRVVGVAPGVAMTGTMVSHIGVLDSARAGVAERGARLPLGRFAEPDDIARMVVVLASDLASYVTGATLGVDGGDGTGGGGPVPLEVLGVAPTR
ncbi:SDR family NAD(P)-dependent oxidoreductase [Pseudonocardia sp. RS010]|uniref:SDR family NAD(P)-dependent oxidoreductase n=1 Tax=Pseudonocardia sp. RS010 TaxID=3385979 RepID=UPI00399F5ED7